MLPTLAVGLSTVIAIPAYIFMLHYRNQQYKKGLFNWKNVIHYSSFV